MRLLLLVGMLICIPLVDAQAAQPPVEVEKEIRDLIYEGSPKIASPIKGKWAFHRVLVVPKQLKTTFSNNRVATLKVLQAIVDGGRPCDALLAAGYAVALADSPVRAAVYCSYSEAKVDRRMENKTISYRQLLAEKMRALLREEAKGK